MVSARTRIGTYELDTRGFIVARVDRGVDMDGNDAREALAATHRVAGDRSRPVLVDLRGIRSQSREAREFFASDEVTRSTRAVALLVASPVSKVIGNFFIRLREQPVPTRLFGDEREAIDWLLGYVE